MPTSYTSPVADGTITDFATFAKRCARAMGALIMMRDDPMDAPVTDEAFEPTDYHQKALVTAKARLRTLSFLTPDEVQEEADVDYAKRVAEWEAYAAEKATTRARYEAMLAEVNTWAAPASHESFRTFMQEQLRESIRFDVYDSLKPERLPASEWLSQKVQSAARDVAYHLEQHEKEVQRCAERKAWWAGLVAALPASSPPSSSDVDNG